MRSVLLAVRRDSIGRAAFLGLLLALLALSCQPEQPAAGGTGGASTGGSAADTGGAATTGGVNTGGSAVGTGGAAAGGVSTGGTSTGGKASGGTSTGGARTGGTGTGGATATGGSAGASGGPGSSTELCTRWNADRADLSESGWTGSASTCTPGDMSATSRANALRLVNLYRWIAGLPPVATSDSYNQQDQACALIMEANDQISHSPTSSWACYTAAGATAAQNSCVAGTGAVAAVPSYLVDPGNETTLGHRRWVLSNYLGPIGIGSTGNYSCMWTGTTGKAGKQWTAWPPPGYFPLQAATDSWNRSLDTTGWSVQSDTVNLSGAVVTITLNGTTQPVTVTQLASGYGSDYAIRIAPNGWKMAAGNTYHVAITGIATPISYDVQVVSCS